MVVIDLSCDCRWQQLEHGDNEDDSVFSSRRQSLNSQGSRRPSKEDSGRGSFAKTENKPFTRVCQPKSKLFITHTKCF